MAQESSGRGLQRVALPRMDVRLLAGAALVAVSVVGSLTLWRQAQVTAPVVVAARAIDEGDVIEHGDLELSEARLQGALATLAVPAEELPALAGRTATGPLYAGELIVGPDLGAGPAIGPDELAVTIPVPDDSVYARLRRGDAVAVMATTDPGQPESKTSWLLERATVYAVALEAARVSLGGGGGDEEAGRPTNVTLIVPRERAARVAHALVNAELTLMLLAPDPIATGRTAAGEGGER